MTLLWFLLFVSLLVSIPHCGLAQEVFDSESELSHNCDDLSESFSDKNYNIDAISCESELLSEHVQVILDEWQRIRQSDLDKKIQADAEQELWLNGLAQELWQQHLEGRLLSRTVESDV